MQAANDPPAPDAASALFMALLTMTPEQRARALSDDPVHVRRLAQAAAVHGLIEGQLLFARMLLAGTGGTVDRDQAFSWFIAAAKSDNAEAWNMLGRCHENGWGTPIDRAQASLWFHKAAQAGHDWAQYNLGHLYLNGHGVVRNAAQAFRWYKTAADQGHARAMNLVGRCYEHGWGVACDLFRASQAYQASAESGYFRGQFNHASLLAAQGRMGEALEWFRRAIDGAPQSSHAAMTEAFYGILDND